MTRGTDAFSRLMTAMEDTDPACQDDDRFVLDDQPAHTLVQICRACPVFDLCKEYAAIAKPAGGVWAGRRYVNARGGREGQS